MYSKHNTASYMLRALTIMLIFVIDNVNFIYVLPEYNTLYFGYW